MTSHARSRTGDPPTGLPRLLAGIPARGALTLDEHLALHGSLPVVDGRRGAHALIEEVDAAGLRGRGGAGFPTAAKLRAVVAAARSPLGGRPLVVVNAAEGEPASAKDRTLLRALPHLVLDGAALAAAAVGAREVLLGVCESSVSALEACARAIAERAPAGRGARAREGRGSRAREGRDGHPGDRGLFAVHPVPARYVAGQESALVHHLDGGPALPTFTPPRPFTRGVRGRPTLVCNVETLAHLALLARHGPAWFRELGTPAHPGSALVTLSGPVAHPGVYEIEHGSPLAALLDAAGGATAPLRAVLLGGYGGTWLDVDVALGGGGAFATLGAGVVALLPADACPVAELARLTRWLAGQSARQCGPCVFGLDALATLFEQLAGGGAGGAGATVASLARLSTLAGLVAGRGACGHPDGAARLVASAVTVFGEELAAHARHGGAGCAECARRRSSARRSVRGRVGARTAQRAPEPAWEAR